MEDKHEFIAERVYHNESGEAQITVRIGRPERVAEGEYRCAFQLLGLGGSPILYAYGIDGFQALQMALEGIRAGIEKSGKSLFWQGGEAGDVGFPRTVPVYYGPEFAQRINRLIDEEVERFARQAQERSRHTP